jgi:hypothetical protein
MMLASRTTTRPARSTRLTRRAGARSVLLLVAGITALIIAGGAEGAAPKPKMLWKVLKPTKSVSQICLRVGGKEQSFYKLSAQKATELSVYGPGRLKVVTRHLPIKGKLSKRAYTLVVMRDGTVALKKKITRGTSKVTLCKNKKTLAGAAIESFIKVPAGKHTYRVLVEESGKEVVARFYQEKRETVEARLIGFTPLEYDGICTLATKSGTGTPWFRATFAQPIRFGVQGPTELEIRTRLDLGPAVTGTVRYGIEILRNGKSDSVRSYSVTRDAKASYKDCPGVTPGESKLIRLSVPAGNWTYEIRPAGTGAQSFATRILIPRSSVGVDTRTR